MACYPKWSDGTDPTPYIQQTLVDMLPLIQNAAMNAPEWLDVELAGEPTNDLLVYLGEADGRRLWCHRDDEERLRIHHNLPKPE